MEPLTKSLLLAVKKDNVKEVTRLIEHGVDVNGMSVHFSGNTALHISVLQSNKKITKLLIKAGANVNLKNRLGYTPLNFALDANHTKICKILIGAGGDITATTKNGKQAMEVLLNRKNGNYRTKISLIENLLKDVPKSSLDQIRVKDQPLMHFVFESKYMHMESASRIVKFIRTFVKLGFNINVKGKDGDTILHTLLDWKRPAKGYLKILRCLLENGADANAINDYGVPVLYALTPNDTSYESCKEKIKLLAKYGADFSVVNMGGMTPLHRLCTYMKQENIIRILIERGVSISHQDFRRETALDVACQARSMSYVRIFLDHGATIDWLQAFKQYLRGPGREENDCFYDRDIKFLMEHIDVNSVYPDGKSLLSHLKLKDNAWMVVIKHIALIEALDHPIDRIVYDEISKNVSFDDYFTRCRVELMRVGRTRVSESTWVTYLHLLTGTERQLKNFAGNYDLMSEVLIKISPDFEILFPIYGSDIREKVFDGMKIRQLFDKATKVLGREIPILDDLIIQETLDCILSEEDLSKMIDCL